MNVPADWWQTFFTGVFVELWLKAVTPEQTRAEVDFLTQVLQLPASARVLDVPCGGGRHALELATRGHQVTGVDFAPEFLAVARAGAAERNLSVTWEQCDMRDLPWSGVFDGACCLGNSFGYMDDESNAAFLRAVARTLKPGGRFALNTGTAAESSLPNYKERGWYEIGDIRFLIRNEHDHVRSRLNSELTIIRGTQVEKRLIFHRIYTYCELCGLLEDAGFGEFQGFNGVTKEPFRLGAHDLLLVATRR
jgi:SAM-dependent methyltransferase